MSRILLLALLLLAGGLVRESIAAPSPPADASLTFYENRGQWPAAARFGAALPGGTLFVEPAGFVYSLRDSAARPLHGAPAAAPGPPSRGHAYAVHFEGAKPAAPQGAEQLPGHRNYYLGADPSHWATGVLGFRQVHYPELYPGIDAMLYENERQRLEYDFVVAPGARPGAIVLRYDGAAGLTLDAAGNLRVKTSVATVTELAPRAWQTSHDGRRKAVPCAFVLRENQVSFRLGAYDPALPLTIDPEVIFNSHSGATSLDYGLSGTYDAAGNVYSAGCSFSAGYYPTTLGAYVQTSRQSDADVVVSKFAAQVQGQASLLYSAIIGGGATDVPTRVVVNSQNELLIIGATASNNFPTTTGAFDTSFGGGAPGSVAGPITFSAGSDVFVLKLGAVGELLASTYLGGSANDGLLNPPGTASLFHNYGDALRGDVAADAAGNIFVATYTASADFPRGSSALPYHGGAHDAAVCRLSPDLRRLEWTALLGGGGDDAAYSLALAPDGNLYVAGGTLGGGGLQNTAGGYVSAPPSGASSQPDGFVTRLTSAGVVLQSTYLGTSAYDQAYFVDVDAGGSVYVMGQTLGAYPTTAGALATASGSQFIQQLTPALTGAGFAAVFGSGRAGITDFSPMAFGLDACGKLYVAGWSGNSNALGTISSTTTLANMPVTPDALRSTTDGFDLYFARLAVGGARLEYGTYYGALQGIGAIGEHADGGASRFDRAGRLYYSGCAGCGGLTFPMVPGAGYYQLTNAGGFFCNQTTLKLDMGDGSGGTVGAPLTVCDNGTAVALTTGRPAGGTWSGPGVSGSLAGGFFFTPTAQLVGTQQLTYTLPAAAGVCRLPASQLAVRVLGTGPVQVGPLPARLCSGPGLAPIQLTGMPAGGTFSGPGVVGNEFRPATLVPGTYTIRYTVPTTTCGGGTASVVVQLVSQAPPVAGLDTVLCASQTRSIRLLGNPAGGIWSGPGVSGSVATGFVFTSPGTPGTAVLTYQVTSGSCAGQAIRLFTLVAAPVPVALLAPTPCSFVGPGTGLATATGLAPFTVQTVNNTPAIAGIATSYVWDFGDGQTSTERAPAHTYGQPGTYAVRLTASLNGGCANTAVASAVTVVDPLVPNIITPNGDDVNDYFVQHFSCLPVQLRVYSRWGQEVFRAEEYANNWNAADVSAGIYYLVLLDTAGRRYRGWLEVVK
ncbi:DUF7948 domain-containing protein [Hymenobacter properus]|uniref:Gliding motility-associated C-terminal domain-containing protein n=1 Tax=Hymenobacter properus TaxID=2791026 RepID=A0A931FMJ7_9BACT|nr:PKD domain-containing protein [Hymenobacter properus]MBF9143176.1 gliding motility-associated C-terminal domain-containing protein [Hymenobacter properus]MBR7721984.1 gliding motility-associated C-terminal domain-containing protein [Microvirga sp. SRT04]